MRVLLVDDDPLILKGLYRTILSQWPEWSIVTSDSGEMAVGLMSRMSFDLVITDMQMPGMDGSTVLKMAKELQPEAVRVVLSGHAPMLRLIESEGFYHRFLMKPIEPSRLLDILASLSLDTSEASLSSARSLVTGLERVPSLPRHAAHLQALLKQPEPNLEEIKSVVTRDIGMAATILKLVNSAYLSSLRPITDLEQAVEFLGVGLLRDLFLNHAGTLPARQERPGGLNLEALWGHSRMMGLIAQQLILHGTGDRALAAEAYAVGLLHDVGMVIIATTPCCGYQSVLNSDLEFGQSLLEMELSVLGTDHGQVGAQLMNLWAFPESFSAAVRDHHAQGRTRQSSLVGLAIHLAHLQEGEENTAPLKLLSAPNYTESTPISLPLLALWESGLAEWQRVKACALAQKPGVAP